MRYIKNPDETLPDGFWWVSTSFATFGVTVKNGKVVRDVSAPITGRFIGGPFLDLVNHFAKDPAFDVACLRPEGEPIESVADLSDMEDEDENEAKT